MYANYMMNEYISKNNYTHTHTSSQLRSLYNSYPRTQLSGQDFFFFHSSIYPFTHPLNMYWVPTGCQVLLIRCNGYRSELIRWQKIIHMWRKIKQGKGTEGNDKKKLVLYGLVKKGLFDKVTLQQKTGRHFRHREVLVVGSQVEACLKCCLEGQGIYRVVRTMSRVTQSDLSWKVKKRNWGIKLEATIIIQTRDDSSLN